MKEFADEEYFMLEKYVVTKGDNWDGDRYFEIHVDGVDVTMCFNEYDRKAMLCGINGDGVSASNRIIAQECLNKLLYLSQHNTGYTDKEEKYYSFYLDEIQAEIEYPEEDDNMLVLQVSNWEDIKKGWKNDLEGTNKCTIILENGGCIMKEFADEEWIQI